MVQWSKGRGFKSNNLILFWLYTIQIQQYLNNRTFGYRNGDFAVLITEYLDNRTKKRSVVESVTITTFIPENSITEHIDNRTSEMFGYRIYRDSRRLVIEVRLFYLNPMPIAIIQSEIHDNGCFYYSLSEYKQS